LKNILMMKNNDLKQLINVFLEKNNLKEGVTNIDISNAWFKMMKNGIANYTQEVKLKNKILYIKLSSPSLKQELSYGKEKLIDMINERFKNKIVEKITFY
tara:strand:+ start:2473 stop:2772 length:300 start_codon:yes stop_codon:yes gene_type:complete